MRSRGQAARSLAHGADDARAPAHGWTGVLSLTLTDVARGRGSAPSSLLYLRARRGDSNIELLWCHQWEAREAEGSDNGYRNAPEPRAWRPRRARGPGTRGAGPCWASCLGLLSPAGRRTTPRKVSSQLWFSRLRHPRGSPNPVRRSLGVRVAEASGTRTGSGPRRCLNLR